MPSVAVDIGGTFTDLVVQHSDGRWNTAKVLSTPESQVSGVLDAISAADIAPEQITLFIHGTTAGLNALLQRAGARVALVITSGFRDVYLIARGNRPHMYALHYRKPAPLVDRASIFEVDERTAPSGEELAPVDLGSVSKAADEIAAGHYEAIAVCLLHAYANPAHERAVAGLLQERFPHVPIVASDDVAPEWREYD